MEDFEIYYNLERHRFVIIPVESSYCTTRFIHKTQSLLNFFVNKLIKCPYIQLQHSGSECFLLQCLYQIMISIRINEEILIGIKKKISNIIQIYRRILLIQLIGTIRMTKIFY